ncbi:MAG TPA: methyltransferase [Actinomycetes bacterium]|nr:methyltransferase [Actinomycetes bacterium]
MSDTQATPVPPRARAGPPPDQDQGPAPLLALGLAFWGSRTFLSAVELGLFTELAAGPLTLEELRERLGLHPRGARDFFDALVALGVLARDQDGRYANTPATAAYLDRGKPAYVGGLMEMASARLYGFWGDLTEGLRTGLPQNELKRGGPGLFEVMYSDPEVLRGFLRAMTGVSMGAVREIARRFPFDRYHSFVDVGCAEGSLSVQVSLAHPHVTGGGFDLPEVGPMFDAYVAEHGLADRLRFHPGDFWRDPLPAADVLALGHVLHDWDLDEKRQLLAKAYAALPDGGALIVHEAIIDDDRSRNAFGLLMSLNMLLESPGGFDFTGADCQRWMREAGFRETRVEALVGPDSMVVGIK